MTRQFWLAAVLVLTGTAVGGEELPAGKSIRVYHVADIVATAAVHSAGSGISQLPREALRQEHPETLAALERLGKLIATMIPAEDGVVEVIPESLALVIRRSPDDHAAIAVLLEELRRETEAPLEIAATVLADVDPKDPVGEAALEELGKLYFQQFTSGDGLKPDELPHIHELFGRIQGVVVELPTVRVRPGFRTTWGTSANPLSVTALISPTGETVTLRIDAPIGNASGGYNDAPADGKTNVRTSKLELKSGHSFLYEVSADDSGCMYLVTVRKRSAAGPVTAAVPNAAPRK